LAQTVDQRLVSATVAREATLGSAQQLERSACVSGGDQRPEDSGA
jgi:hypothetical protein